MKRGMFLGIAGLMILLTMIVSPAAADLDAAAKFFDGLTVKSDMLVFYEGYFDDEIGGNSAGYGYGGSLNDRSRGRYTLRIGFTKRINEEVIVGVRLTTGAQSAVTHAQTFNDNFGNDEFDVDQAYITWTPSWIQNLSLTAGKMPNPFIRNGSWLIWDADVTPEGASQRYTFDLGSIDFTYTQGQFFLQDTGNRYTHVAAGTGDANNEDPYLFAFQFGGDYDGTQVDLGLHAAYYNFKHMEGAGLAGNGNTPTDLIAGTASARSEFEIFDLLGYARFEFILPIQITAEWATNLDAAPTSIGYTDAGANNFTSPRFEEDDAWYIRLDLNKINNPGDWAFSYTYANVEADAVVNGLTDGYLTSPSLSGYNTNGAGARGVSRSTNTEAHRISLSYALLKNTSLTAFYQLSEVENEELAKYQDGVVNGTVPNAGQAGISGWDIPDRQTVVTYMQVKW